MLSSQPAPTNQLTNFQELAEVTTNPPTGVKVSLVHESNVHNWNIVMDGPSDSPYAVCPLSIPPITVIN